MEENKEVYFNEYCSKCKHEKNKEGNEGFYDSPCEECLSEPTNYASHKPIKFEQSEKLSENR